MKHNHLLRFLSIFLTIAILATTEDYRVLAETLTWEQTDTQISESLLMEDSPSEEPPIENDNHPSKEVTEPTELAEPTEPTEPAEPTEPTEPTEATEPTEPTEPTLKEETPVPEEEQIPSVSIQWVPESNNTIHLSASLESFTEETSVDVSIHLNQEEAEALVAEPLEGLTLENLESGALLRFTLSGQNPRLTSPLYFSPASPDLVLHVEQSDISAKLSTNSQGKVEIFFFGEDLTSHSQYDWNIISNAPQSIQWNELKDSKLEFSIIAESGSNLNSTDLSQTLNLSLVLPPPLTFFSGELFCQEDSALFTINGIPAANLMGLPADTKISGYSCDGQQLDISLVRTAKENSPLPSLNLTAVLYGKAMEMIEPSSLPMTMSDEPILPAISLTAELRSVPIWGESYALSKSSLAKTDLKISHIKINEYAPAITQNIFWVDNGNADNTRPTDKNIFMPALLYHLKKSPDTEGTTEFVELTDENRESLGIEKPLSEIISFQQSPKNTDRYIYQINDKVLPAKISKTDIYGDTAEYEIEWKLQPKEFGIIDGKGTTSYHCQQVTQEEITNGKYPSISEPGIYYIQLCDITFNAGFRVGGKPLMDAAKEIKTTLANNFSLVSCYGSKCERTPFSDLVPSYEVEFKDHSLSIKNTWKYNLDGKPIVYYAEHKKDAPLPPVPESLGDEGDVFTLVYDNTDAFNYGTDVEKLYPNGKLWLTLTGETTYRANKVWLDNKNTNRPKGELHLWRYLEDKPYTTAAPVYEIIQNADGSTKQQPILRKLNTTQDSYEITFDGKTFPKYDTEGYRYIYVVKEYMEGSGYEQVFGKVDPDGTVTDTLPSGTVRTADNTLLYNGGTLSNRIKDTQKIKVTKIWEASAFQAGFSDVKIELELYSRPAGSTSEEDWKIVPQNPPLVLDGFSPEQLTKVLNLSLPRYDSQGHELEYLCIESGVYQKGKDGNFGENLLNRENHQGHFELLINVNGHDRQVKFNSKSTIEKEGNTVIKNTIDDTVDYRLEKKWLDKDGKDISTEMIGKSVEFGIYRTLSGQETESKYPIATITLDGKVDEKPTTITPKGEAPISVQEIEPWIAKITPLTEFDDVGHEYEYCALEMKGLDGYLMANSVTTRDADGNYTTVVTNAPGKDHAIHVRKEWIDDSDTIRRYPVTIQAYRKDNHEPVGKPLTLQDGMWYGIIGIGELTKDQVYILETTVDGTEVPRPVDKDGNRIVPECCGSDPTRIEYTLTNKQRYEVTYGTMKVGKDQFFLAQNHRLGTVNLTAAKEWLDGDSSDPNSRRNQIMAALDALQPEKTPVLTLSLEFTNPKSYYVISRTDTSRPDTISVGGEKIEILNAENLPVSSRQKINYQDNISSYEFFNLPKYDKEGDIIHYTIKEEWILNGNPVSIESLKDEPDYKKLYDLLSEYSFSVTQPAGEAGYKVTPEADIQNITVTNRLSGTKTVSWYKVWKDAYAYEKNIRPDIYLDIYQQKHTSDGKKAISIFRSDYKWAPTHTTDTENKWTATFTGLPKYDAFGYEIFYFARERSTVDFESFDYLPAKYLYDHGKDENTTEIGTVYNIQQDALDKNYAVDVTGMANSPSGNPNKIYALTEGGTFVNALSNSVKINGTKLWRNLPAGYQPKNLPTITITASRHVKDKNGNKVLEQLSANPTTLTISDWTKIYNTQGCDFVIAYEGTNTNSVKDGKITCTGEEGAKGLPKYDGLGRIFTYELKEEITWPDGVSGPVSADAVWDWKTNSFEITNTYDSDKGHLNVKKILELPVDGSNTPTAYPAVKFQLYRTFTQNDKTTSGEELVKEQIWSSADVKAAYEASDPKSKPLEHTLKFENLDIYAPNGSEYSYIVKEVKEGFLMDFETWAKEGDFQQSEIENVENKKSGNTPKVKGLSLTPDKTSTEAAATFLNKPKTSERETIYLEGTKTWEDFDNAFGFRPTDLKITLTRTAPSQPGQNNSIPSEEIPLITDGTGKNLVWTKNDNIWTYTICKSSDGNGTLDRYAPNGMPWAYHVKENLSDKKYHSVPAKGTVDSAGAPANDGKLSMKELTNSIMTNAKFQKHWVDSDGTITKDYYGKDFTLTVKLQVGTKNTSDHYTWQDAETYFKGDKSFNSSYQFTKVMTGRLNAPASTWSCTFENLPLYVADTSSGGSSDPKPEPIKLYYRIVETQVTVDGEFLQSYSLDTDPEDGKTYTYKNDSGFFTPYYGDGNNHNSLADIHTAYNKLETSSASVAKKWVGDHDNAYHTRPQTGKYGDDWETSFVLQRKTSSDSNWEIVKNGTKPVIVHLYGKNTEDTIAPISITGLPKNNLKKEIYTYQFWELQNRPNDPDYWHKTDTVLPDDILTEGSHFNSSYKVSYSDDGKTVTNTLAPKIDLQAQKTWLGSDTENITLTLQYLRDDGVDGVWTDIADVELDGKKDTSSLPYCEDKPWHAIWKDIPEVMPNSKLLKDGKTQYRIVETCSDTFLNVGADGTFSEDNRIQPVEEGKPASFTNVKKTSFTVRKVWSSTATPKITFEIYRTTDKDDIGKTSEGKKVPDDLIPDNSKTLPDNENWERTYTNLPKYDENGNLYYYYAIETTIDSEDVSTLGDAYKITYQHPKDTDTGNQTTTITNAAYINAELTKEWKDNSNSYNTRPDALKLTLERSTDNATWKEVNSSEYTLTQNSDNTWKYSFAHLLQCDENNNTYTYRVKENVPTGYSASSAGGTVIINTTDAKLTNTLTKSIDIPVTKLWEDNRNNFKTRPDSITLKLFANDEDTGKSITLKKSLVDLTPNTWKDSFIGLDKFDSEGKLIVYTVKEDPIPDGYEVVYGTDPKFDIEKDGLTLTNYGNGKLSIEKIVTGNAGSHNKEFTFTVTFKTKDGKDELTDSFPYVIEDSTGKKLDSKDNFKSGDSVKLRHGDKVIISNLPYDTPYHVEESDYGEYTVTMKNHEGKIKSGTTAEVKFINELDIPPLPDDDPKNPPDPMGGGEPPENPDSSKPHKKPDKPDSHTPGSDSETMEHPEKPHIPQTGVNRLLPILLGVGGTFLLTAGIILLLKGKHRK